MANGTPTNKDSTDRDTLREKILEEFDVEDKGREKSADRIMEIIDAHDNAIKALYAKRERETMERFGLKKV